MHSGTSSINCTESPMKLDRIPTRRKPIRRTLSARLFNKAKSKRQHASAASGSHEDMEDSGINISRSLTIIFAIHIVAIGMIFIHKQYLSGRTPEPVSSEIVETAPKAPAPSAMPSRKFSSGEASYMVEQGDNFPVIAAKLNVEESDLRNSNVGRDIRPGAVLRIPQSKRIVAEDPPEVAAIRNQPGINDSDRGLVEINPSTATTRAQIIRPIVQNGNADTSREIVVESGRTHILKAGENIWRISTKYNVSQKELMALNNITDPTKLKIGQVIKLP